MDHTPNSSSDGFVYDAILTKIDSARRLLVFEVGPAMHRIPCAYWEVFSPGAVGRLRLPTDAEPFVFQTYPDQQLRRAPAADHPAAQQWGWALGTRQFTVQAGLLPGRKGAVVRRDTESLPLEVPREFLSLCHKSKLTPQAVLRGFIADLCGLISWINCPREDGYSSLGSDERNHAQAYFQRAFGWADTDEGSAPARRRPRTTPTADSKSTPKRRRRSPGEAANSSVPASTAPPREPPA